PAEATGPSTETSVSPPKRKAPRSLCERGGPSRRWNHPGPGDETGRIRLPREHPSGNTLGCAVHRPASERIQLSPSAGTKRFAQRHLLPSCLPPAHWRCSFRNARPASRSGPSSETPADTLHARGHESPPASFGAVQTGPSAQIPMRDPLFSFGVASIAAQSRTGKKLPLHFAQRVMSVTAGNSFAFCYTSPDPQERGP